MDDSELCNEICCILSCVNSKGLWDDLEGLRELSYSELLSGSKIDLAAIAELQLMTTKPFLYVFNVDAAELSDLELRASLQKLVAPAKAIFLDAKTEAELAREISSLLLVSKQLLWVKLWPIFRSHMLCL